MDKTELADAALAFANELRASVGQPAAERLAPGVPKDCAGCPIAITAGGAKVSELFGFAGGWVIAAGRAVLFGPRGGFQAKVTVPDTALEFMAAFDADEYPELVKGDTIIDTSREAAPA